MDIADDKGTCQRQHVVAALQLLWMVGKTGSTEVFVTEMVLLDHCSHGTIQDADTIRAHVDIVPLVYVFLDAPDNLLHLTVRFVMDRGGMQVGG